MEKHEKKKLKNPIGDEYDVQYFSSSVPFLFVLVTVGLVVVVFVTFIAANLEEPSPNCTDSCRLVLAESIPVKLTYPKGSPTHPSIFKTWLNMVKNANSTIDIASLYWTLRSDDLPVKDPTSKEGQELFDAVMEAGLKRGVKIRIAVDASMGANDNDTKLLKEKGAAEVRYVNMSRLEGSGVLHTKMWLIDGKHFTVGSANIDWRALTQVKELIGAIYDCECYAADMAKIFEVYWEMGVTNATVPSNWPSSLSTRLNMKTPLDVTFNGSLYQTYLASSPPNFCPSGRTTDIDAIIDVMDKAQKFIDISVMDYEPLMSYVIKPNYWPIIDDKLREMAVDRRVTVRLMTSHWGHTAKIQQSFLQSLAALNSTGRSDIRIEVKRFVVPNYTHDIPYTRVNHCKFMVTDNTAYVGTSNWSEDYFTVTGGIGLILNTSSSTTFRDELQAVFDRDWQSEYAHPVIVPPLPPPST